MVRLPGLPLFLLLLVIIPAEPRVAVAQGATSENSKRTPPKPTPASPKQNEIAHGRYLVVEVARCPDCHTPRDSEGKLDMSRWLQGSPIWIMPVQSKRVWSAHAPALAHFPYSDQQGQDILERGIGTNGNPIQPPMHAYHLQHGDAMAIIAYLRSL